MNGATERPGAAVMVVDDSSMMRGIMAAIVEDIPELTLAGQAENGKQALAMLEQLAPDLILLDIEMPEMNGIEFLRHARLLTDARVIVVSSVVKLESENVVAALELGADDVVVKPSGALSIDMKELRSEALTDAIRSSLARMN